MIAPNIKPDIVNKLNIWKINGLKSLYPKSIKFCVGTSTCGLVAGAKETFEALDKYISDSELEASLHRTGCLGLCEEEPLVSVQIPGRARYIYSKVTPQLASELVSQICYGKIGKRGLLFKIKNDKSILEGNKFSIQVMTENNSESHNRYLESDFVPTIEQYPFFAKQLKIATRNLGVIDPLNIEEYIALGGYSGLIKALNMDPEEIVQEITLSGLRGRGGAGFPTGPKWHLARTSPDPVKYLICNADEGNPGAYMDRTILEGDPFSVIEGMSIAAYAVGAREGFVYIRAEYPLAAFILLKAIEQAREKGFLGECILDTKFSFDLHLVVGHGAYVCGEETALISSVEGKIGEPRPRPPFPTDEGLYGKPTVINNVQTWTYVPPIIVNGSEWFRAIGTEYSKGTKVFSVVGDVIKSGVVEVPMGISIKEVVNDICGGTGPYTLKAVEIGGPGGGFIPIGLIDLPISYENLSEIGAGLGAGLVVLDNRRCIVDMVRHFMEFAVKESCGKCFPCREVVPEILSLITHITEGKGHVYDLDKIADLCMTLKTASLCGLGQTAPNPVMTAMRFFKEEFLIHITEKFCPSGVCKGLFCVQIDYRYCTYCSECLDICPHKAIRKSKEGFVVDTKTCDGCGYCILFCTSGAFKPIPLGSLNDW